MPKRSRYGVKARRGRGSVKRRRLGYRAKRRGVRGRRSARSNPTRSVIRNPSGFPDRLFVKLKYNDTVRVQIGTSPTAGVLSVWRGNGLFDPDLTYVGHQPYAYDIWASLYKRYCVYGSKISAQFGAENFTSAGTNVNGITAFVIPATDSTVVVPATLRELPQARIRQHYFSYTRMPRISHYSSTARATGNSKEVCRTEISYSADVGSDPTRQWYWLVGAQHASLSDLASQAINIFMTVTIEYYVCFYDRQWLTQS